VFAHVQHCGFVWWWWCWWCITQSNQVCLYLTLLLAIFFPNDVEEFCTEKINIAFFLVNGLESGGAGGWKENKSEMGTVW